mmetsp:Transcript_125533/g.360890  ORF Transcript_125533/g.360890 Transcript_125533/m.360890 type:complete len:436 (+) Transcript_125533:119-1426(+)
MQIPQQQEQPRQQQQAQPEQQELQGADVTTVGAQPLRLPGAPGQAQQLQQQPDRPKPRGADASTIGALQLQQPHLLEQLQQLQELQQLQRLRHGDKAYPPAMCPTESEARPPALPQSPSQATRVAAARLTAPALSEVPAVLPTAALHRSSDLRDPSDTSPTHAPDDLGMDMRLRRSCAEVCALASELLATPLGQSMVRAVAAPPCPGPLFAPQLHLPEHGAAVADVSDGLAAAGAATLSAGKAPWGKHGKVVTPPAPAIADHLQQPFGGIQDPWPTLLESGSQRGPAIDHPAVADFAAGCGAGARSGRQVEQTTLMIRGLPQDRTQEDMLKLWPTSVWKYDFFFLPRNIGGKCNFGYAFVNFISEAHARAFKAAWHRVSLPSQERTIAITFADVQGFEANMARLSGKRVNRSKARFFRPAVFRSDLMAGDSPAAP